MPCTNAKWFHHLSVTRKPPCFHTGQTQSHFLWCEAMRPLYAIYKGSFGSFLHSGKVSPSRAPFAPGGSQVWPYPSPLLSNKTDTQSYLISNHDVPYRTCGGTCCTGGSTPKNQSLADLSKNHPQTMKVATFPTVSRPYSNLDIYQLRDHSYHTGWKTTNHHSSTYNKSNNSILKLWLRG
jgi:hypothetical protein